MICPHCHVETATFQTFSASGMVTKCGNEGCYRQIDETPVTVAQVQAQPQAVAAAHGFPPVANGMFLRRPQAEIAQPQPSGPAAPRPVATLPADEATVDTYVTAMRARLVVVKARLADMRRLQDEESTLERMLAAAGPPLN